MTAKPAQNDQKKTGADQGVITTDPEVKAMTTILKAMATLPNPEAQQRVLNYLNGRYIPQSKKPESPVGQGTFNATAS